MIGGNNNLSRELRRDDNFPFAKSFVSHGALRGMFRSYCYPKRSSSEGLLLVQGPIASKGKTKKAGGIVTFSEYLLCSSTVLSTFIASSNGY